MIGIIGAMEEEISLLLQKLSKIQKIQRGAFIFYRGSLLGQDTVILQCGIGKVNAAIGAALMIELFEPGFILNTGAAGGIGADLKIGDLIISETIVHHDVDVTAFGYKPGQVPKLPAEFTSHPRLLQEAVTITQEQSEINAITGLVASGDVFMEKPQTLAGVIKNFPGVRAIEMESAAIAQTCYQLKTPFLIIRAVSDRADADSPGDFAEHLHIAAKNSARLVLALVEKSSHFYKKGVLQ